MAPTGPVLFCQLLLNCALYDTKIGCILLDLCKHDDCSRTNTHYSNNDLCFCGVYLFSITDLIPHFFTKQFSFLHLQLSFASISLLLSMTSALWIWVLFVMASVLMTCVLLPMKCVLLPVFCSLWPVFCCLWQVFCSRLWLWPLLYFVFYDHYSILSMVSVLLSMTSMLLPVFYYLRTTESLAVNPKTGWGLGLSSSKERIVH